MKITRVIWLKRFSEKITFKHRVSGEEVEQLFLNRARFELKNVGTFWEKISTEQLEELMPVVTWLYFSSINASDVLL
jgi:hypothetical protein